MAEPADQLDDQPVYDKGGTEPSNPPPGLKEKEGRPEVTGADKEGFYESGQPSREQLADAEYSAPARGGQGASFYKPAAKGPLKGRAKGFKKRYGALMAIIALLLVGLPIIFILLFGAFKLHHLSEHLERRLARSAREFNRSADKVLAEKADIDAGDVKAADLASTSPLGKAMDLIKPDRVISRMESNNVLDFQYTKGRLTAVVIDGETIDAPQLKLGQFFKNRQAKIDFYNKIFSKVNESLRDTTSYQIRSRVGKTIIERVGGHLYWWQNKGESEENETPEQAERDEQLKLFEYVDTPSEGAVTDGIDKTAQEAREKEIECLENTACATDVLDGQLNLLDAPGVGSTITDYLKNLASKQSLARFSTVVSIMLPVCMVYDGSVESSSALIDAQNSAAIKAYLAITSADSQAIDGGANGKAVGAFNSLLGNISETNPEKLARGEPINTSGEPSTEASRAQTFTIFSNLPGAGIFSSLTFVCHHLLNPAVIAGLLGGEFIIGVGTDFEGTAAEQGLKDVVTAYFKKTFENIVEKYTILKQNFVNKALKFALVSGGVFGATVGATYLAKMLVLSEMGSMINGDQADYVNSADQGGVIMNDDLSRQQDYGRPMTAQETAGSDVEDAQYAANLDSNESTYQRYFAFSNPDSFLSNEAVAISGAISQPHRIVDAFMGVPRELMSGFRTFSAVLFGHAHALAAAAVVNDTMHYNQVEWGWSTSEERLINSDSSYDPLENAQILTDSGQAGNITKKYGPCYSDDIQTLLTTKPSGNKNFYITRDESGNVTNQGLCSPQNLGPNNSEFGPQMVFRWRLNQSYQSAISEMSDIQNAPASSTTTP